MSTITPAQAGAHQDARDRSRWAAELAILDRIAENARSAPTSSGAMLEQARSLDALTAAYATLQGAR